MCVNQMQIRSMLRLHEKETLHGALRKKKDYEIPFPFQAFHSRNKNERQQKEHVFYMPKSF